MTPNDHRVSYRKFVLPREHGGWSFVLEPVILALVVAWSPSGLLVGFAALATFLAREPLRLSASDLIVRRKRFPRTVPAAVIAATWLTIVVVLLLIVMRRHGWQPLIPIALVSPLALAQAYADLFGSKRRLGVEMAGAVAMSASAPVIVLLTGEAHQALGLVLWFFVAARSVGAVLYVREKLSKTKSASYSMRPPVGAHLAAVIIASSLYVANFAPGAGILAFAILLGRTVHGLSSPALVTPQRVGAMEVFWGAVTIVIITLGYSLGI